jgi:hypothetical protein
MSVPLLGWTATHRGCSVSEKWAQQGISSHQCKQEEERVEFKGRSSPSWKLLGDPEKRGSWLRMRLWEAKATE